MLINDSQQFRRTPFDNEAEIERVVQKYAEHLFGSSIIYLPQTRISTLGGKNTVPDAIVIDGQSEEWFVVEAERAVHGTWEHIAPQVSRQLAAVGSAKTRELILEIALKMIAQDDALRELFKDLGIDTLGVHGKVHKILQKKPTIAIPIDGIPKDLKEWVQTLRNNVKIWVIEKYALATNPDSVLYSLPDENLPTISTGEGKGNGLPPVMTTTGSQPFRELLDAFPSLEGQHVFLEYGPRGKPKQTFDGTIKKEGIEVDGKVYSPSYAAVHCIQKAGSPRKTANGWTMWKTKAGKVPDRPLRGNQRRGTGERGKGGVLGMDSYFVRHTKSMTVRDEDLDRLWAANRIALHFPGEGEEDSRSLDPDDYAYESEGRAIRRLVELAENGGYVWAESRIDRNAKVGVVRPGTEIELHSAIWTLPNDSRYSGRGGSEAILKTLMLDRVGEIAPYEAENLRAVRPPRGTIMRWRACGDGLEALVEGNPD